MKEIIFAGGVYGYCGRNMEASQVRDQLEGAEKSDLKNIEMESDDKDDFSRSTVYENVLKECREAPVTSAGSVGNPLVPGYI